MKTIAFTDTLLNQTEIIKSKKIAVLGLMLTLAGLAMIISAVCIPGMTMPLLGTMVLVPGLCVLLKGKIVYTLKTNGKTLVEKVCYYKQSDITTLVESLKNRDSKALAAIAKSKDDAGGVRVDLLETPEKDFVWIQLMQYRPFSFYPVLDLISLQGDEAREMSKAFSRGSA